jgi:hypothetical protein
VRELLFAHVTQVRAGPDGELDDAVEKALRVAVPRRVALPHLGLSLLLEHDQSSPAQASLALLKHGQAKRLGQALSTRHVDQDAVRPIALVAGDERVVARDDRAEAGGDELRHALHRLREREYHRPAVFGGQSLESVDGACAGRVGVEIQVGEVRELPPLRLRGGKCELARQRGALSAPLNQPIRLSGRDGLSQSSLPFEAR